VLLSLTTITPMSLRMLLQELLKTPY